MFLLPMCCCWRFALPFEKANPNPETNAKISEPNAFSHETQLPIRVMRSKYKLSFEKVSASYAGS